MYLLVRIVSVVVMVGNFFADGPLPPTLDMMLRIFGFRMVPAGIEQAWPLLLTYEEAEAVPVLPWILEWLAIGSKPVLMVLVLGLTYWTVMHFYDQTDNLGASVLKGDFFDVDDGLAEEMEDEEDLEEKELYIGELIPRIHKGRIMKTKFIVHLPETPRGLLGDKDFLKELNSKKGVYIPASIDLIYIEAESREAANDIFSYLVLEFGRVHSKI